VSVLQVATSVVVLPLQLACQSLNLAVFPRTLICLSRCRTGAELTGCICTAWSVERLVEFFFLRQINRPIELPAPNYRPNLGLMGCGRATSQDGGVNTRSTFRLDRTNPFSSTWIARTLTKESICRFGQRLVLALEDPIRNRDRAAESKFI
jgi:hypothetical protein